MSAASFSLYALPNPTPDQETLLEYSSRLKALRLKSLKDDPSSFISRYESEAEQPLEFWLNRHADAGVIHLVVVRDDPDHPVKDEEMALIKSKWVGFVVIAKPDCNDVDGVDAIASEYVMAALYTDSEFRGLGLGKRLIMATLDKIKEHALAEDIKAPYCVTSVRHGNDHALILYKRLGFRVIDTNEHIEKEDRHYTATKMRRDLR